MVYPFINGWAVLIGTLVLWVLGALWYSPVLFGKIWQKEVEFKEEGIKKANSDSFHSHIPVSPHPGMRPTLPIGEIYFQRSLLFQLLRPASGYFSF